MKTWLIFDVNYLCWRAFHVTGHLSHGENVTGTVFGFLKAVKDLKNQFMTERAVFCFDLPPLLRDKKLERYKAGRKEKERAETPAEKKAKAKMRGQVEALRADYLSRIGYRNVFSQPGYEGDDIIAQAVRAVRNRGDRAVIVTGDKDMYQLLEHNAVYVHHPREKVTVSAKGFCKTYGLTPEAWKFVKAIGGCTTDEIPGVPGCREKTALAYLTGKLKKTDARRRAIRSKAGIAVLKRNLSLVILPYAGCKPVTLKPDEYDEKEFGRLCKELGFESLSPARPRLGGFKLET